MKTTQLKKLCAYLLLCSAPAFTLSENAHAAVYHLFFKKNVGAAEHVETTNQRQSAAEPGDYEEDSLFDTDRTLSSTDSTLPLSKAKFGIHIGGVANMSINTRFRHNDRTGTEKSPFTSDVFHFIGSPEFSQAHLNKLWYYSDPTLTDEESSNSIRLVSDEIGGDEAVYDIDLNAFYSLPDIDSIQADVGFSFRDIPDFLKDGDGRFSEHAGIAVAVKKYMRNFNMAGRIEQLKLSDFINGRSFDRSNFHLGFALNIPRIFSLRLGMEEGIPGFGLTFNAWLLKLDFSAYGNHLTKETTEENREFYMGKFSLDW